MRLLWGCNSISSGLVNPAACLHSPGQASLGGGPQAVFPVLGTHWAVVPWMSPPASAAGAQLWSTLPSLWMLSIREYPLLGHEMVDAGRNGFSHSISQSN